ncbi:hypothetical protein BDM02DRAFT_3188688 [Thelephora ganbajun]|uniref:Uncharacterized protein n=1 Tax=Thelephora ganbajun TaxID=370292 RepID=A0ACB6ZAB0_THEGA|nr:hypothetical protein BDM02DRAFT_3188688 [Thelephora ganbajun]
MDRLSDKKRKKSSKPSPKRNCFGTPADVADEPLRFQEELEIGLNDERSNKRPRIMPQDDSGEDRELPVPEPSTSDVVVSGTEHGSDPTRENTTDTGEGQWGGRPAEASKVPEGDYKNTALMAPAILSHVPKEAADESSPLGPLKAVLRTIGVGCANNQETVAIRKIEYLLSRIVALEERFDSRPDGVEELRRRGRLIRELGRIEGKLRPLSEEPEPGRLAERARDNEEVYGLLEDLREAIFDYQKVQQMAIHDQGRKLILRRASSTVSPVQKGPSIDMVTAKGLPHAPRLLVERIGWDGEEHHRPDSHGEDFRRRITWGLVLLFARLRGPHLKLIFPTIAVQLARNYADFRPIFVPLVQSDPGIVHESLCSQMDKLIIRPLKESNVSTVIIIDALDECKDEEPASAILSVLGQFVSQIPKVKFFVTGRPKPRIRTGFRLPLLVEATDVFVLHDVEPSLINNDIQLFFRQGFLELAHRRHELDDWPTKEQLDLLCERAAGLFVYATATIKFVDHRNNDPREQLDRLLRSPESSAREGKTRLKENTTLDSLYMSILQEAFGDDDPEDDHKTRSILGAVILAANPLSPLTIATLLGFGTKSVFLRLSSIHSLLVLQEDIDHPVRPFHKSFPDFIADPTRCTNERFHVSPPNHHPELLAGYLELMTKMLEKNMCNLPDAIGNCEIKGLHERTERHLNPTVQYACRSWHKHLIDEHTVRTPAITSALHRFLEKKFLFWLEVLSVLGAAREAVDALEVAAKWLEVSPTLGLINDCFRFVIGFFEIISTSSPHIYHSALPLCPRQSIVRSLYEPHARPLARIVHGLPDSWESSMAATTFHDLIDAAVWSPCSRFIAALLGDDGTKIEILDAVTLKCITVLHPPLDPLCTSQPLAFSPDARSVTFFGNIPGGIMSWDLQTGGLVSAIELENQKACLSATYSACGTMVATFCRMNSTPTISIYNLLFGTRTYSHSPEGLTLEEVGFASSHTPAWVESLSIPDGFDSSHKYQFHPTSSRLAFATGRSVHVWDARDSKFLLEFTDAEDCRVTSISFSPDGRFFAYGTLDLEIHLWKESPTGYTLHRKFISNTRDFEPLFSPNGESIIAVGLESIQLWRTTDSVASLSGVSTPAFRGSKKAFIAGFSPDEASVAVARTEGETVVVLDLKSGIPRLMIDMGVKVYGVGVAGSAVVVVGEGKIVAWNLPARSHVLNSRVNINDRVLTTAFDHPSFPTWESWPITSVSSDLRRIAMVEWGRGIKSHCLHLYDTLTRHCLASVPIMYGISPWFTLDGCEVRLALHNGDTERWKIIEDSESNITGLEHLGSSSHPPGGFPWRSSRGYRVTDDHWVLSPSGKRLLWLPPNWRLNELCGMWSGRFRALFGSQLLEPVILEFGE